MSDTGATPPNPPQPGAQTGDKATRGSGAGTDGSTGRVIRDVPVEQAPAKLLENIAARQKQTRAETRTQARAETRDTARGERVEARVVSQSKDGTTRLRTNSGEEIVIRTRAKLAEGQRVILQLKNARDAAAQQAQDRPAQARPQTQPQPQTSTRPAQQATPRPVAEADITIPRPPQTTTPARAETLRMAVQQTIRIAVEQGAQIRAQFIPPLQTATPAQQPAPQTPARQAPSSQSSAPQQSAQQAPPQAPQTPQLQTPPRTPPRTPPQGLQQQVAQLLSRTQLPLLPPGALPATAQAQQAITPPPQPALQALNSLPASLKPLLVLLAAQADTPGLRNVPLQQILSRPGLPPLNITQLTPQAALPLLTGPSALFQLGRALAATRPAPLQPGAAGVSQAAPPQAQAQAQSLQPLLQQLGILTPSTGASQTPPSSPAPVPGGAQTASQPTPPQPISALAQGPAVPQPTSLNILQIITPQNIPDSPAALRSLLPQGPLVLTGLVTGPDRAGNPVIATARGQFILTNAQPLPTGTVLSFNIAADVALLREGEFPIWPLPPLDPIQSERWGAMEDAIRTLQADNAAAAQALRNVIPGPVATRFTTATLFFLAALRAGDIGAWMGQQQIQALRDAGRSDIINRLNTDFGRAATQAADVMPGDWRAIPLPFLHEEQVLKIQLFMRQQRERGDKDKDGKKSSRSQTRFLIEAMLSRLGAMQLDGLFTPEDKRLDLVMRTKEALPNDIRNGMAQRYRETVQSTGLAGEIKFQSRGKGWVHLDGDERHNSGIGVDA